MTIVTLGGRYRLILTSMPKPYVAMPYCFFNFNMINDILKDIDKDAEEDLDQEEEL